MNPVGLSVSAADPAGGPNGGSGGAKQGNAPTSSFANVLTEVEGQATPAQDRPTSSALSSEPMVSASEPTEHEASETIDTVALTYNLVITMPENAAPTVPAALPEPEMDLSLTAADLPDISEAGSSNAAKSKKITRTSKSEKDSEKLEHMSLPAPGSTFDPLKHAHSPVSPLPVDIQTPPPTTPSIDSGTSDGRAMTLPFPVEQSGAVSQSAPLIMEARITPKAALESDTPAGTDSRTISHAKEDSRQELSSIEPVVKPEAVGEDGLAKRSPAFDEEEAPHPEETAREQSPSQSQLSPVAPERERLASTPRAPSTEISRQAYIAAEDKQPLKTEHTPLKQMDLRIPDANGDVLVRLQERAGSVHVSVRTNDSTVASNITEGLPELTRTLDRQGFQTETWTSKQTLSDVTGTILKTNAETSHPAQELSRTSAEHLQTPQAESSQAGNDNSEGHRKPDWQEELYRRPKRPSDENFKEYLS